MSHDWSRTYVTAWKNTELPPSELFRLTAEQLELLLTDKAAGREIGNLAEAIALARAKKQQKVDAEKRQRERLERNRRRK